MDITSRSFISLISFVDDVAIEISGKEDNLVVRAMVSESEGSQVSQFDELDNSQLLHRLGEIFPTCSSVFSRHHHHHNNREGKTTVDSKWTWMMLKTWSELNLYRWCVLGYFRPTAKRPALLAPPRHPPPSPTPDRSFPAPLPRLKACEWNANKRLAVPFHSSLARLSDGSGIFVVMLTGGSGEGR